MTQNQINYLKLQEEIRKNKAMEGLEKGKLEETFRSNYAKEIENIRSNQAREQETYRSNVAKEQESLRHNRAGENIDMGYLANDSARVGISHMEASTHRAQAAEAVRHNISVESEATRHNQATEKETYRSNVTEQTQRRVEANRSYELGQRAADARDIEVGLKVDAAPSDIANTRSSTFRNYATGTGEVLKVAVGLANAH